MSAQPAPVPFSPAAVPGTSTPPQAVMPKPAIQKKVIPTTQSKVVGAKILLTYVGEDGKTYEAVTEITQDEFKVQSYSMTVEEKHEKKRDPETKDILGFEDTGERVLNFKLRYHVR